MFIDCGAACAYSCVVTSFSESLGCALCALAEVVMFSLCVLGIVVIASLVWNWLTEEKK